MKTFSWVVSKILFIFYPQIVLEDKVEEKPTVIIEVEDEPESFSEPRILVLNVVEIDEYTS